MSDSTYSDTLEWTVEKPGLIKCFANNSEGSSSETMSLFVTGNLFFNTNFSDVNTMNNTCNIQNSPVLFLQMCTLPINILPSCKQFLDLNC
jgi:hypothetical protein